VAPGPACGTQVVDTRPPPPPGRLKRRPTDEKEACICTTIVTAPGANSSSGCHTINSTAEHMHAAANLSNLLLGWLRLACLFVAFKPIHLFLAHYDSFLIQSTSPHCYPMHRALQPCSAAPLSNSTVRCSCALQPCSAALPSSPAQQRRPAISRRAVARPNPCTSRRLLQAAGRLLPQAGSV
jgi:hypothetical protein